MPEAEHGIRTLATAIDRGFRPLHPDELRAGAEPSSPSSLSPTSSSRSTAPEGSSTPEVLADLPPDLPTDASRSRRSRVAFVVTAAACVVVFVAVAASVVSRPDSSIGTAGTGPSASPVASSEVTSLPAGLDPATVAWRGQAQVGLDEIRFRYGDRVGMIRFVGPTDAVIPVASLTETEGAAIAALAPPGGTFVAKDVPAGSVDIRDLAQHLAATFPGAIVLTDLQDQVIQFGLSDSGVDEDTVLEETSRYLANAGLAPDVSTDPGDYVQFVQATFGY